MTSKERRAIIWLANNSKAKISLPPLPRGLDFDRDNMTLTDIYEDYYNHCNGNDDSNSHTWEA